MLVCSDCGETLDKEYFKLCDIREETEICFCRLCMVDNIGGY